MSCTKDKLIDSSWPSSFQHSTMPGNCQVYQQSLMSAGSSDDASYKLWQKLHQKDDPAEKALTGHSKVADTLTKSVPNFNVSCKVS